MSVILQSSSGGQITIQEPATASNFTQTLPAATGDVMVSGNMPAFSALPNSNQSFTSSTWTKVAFNSEEFDTNNNYDATTNYRFTPTVAGYYQINAVVSISGTVMTQFICAIYKNNAEYKRGNQLSYATGVSNSSCLISSVVYLNGSTDYVEIYGFGVGTSPSFIGGASSVNCSFNGSMVRTA